MNDLSDSYREHLNLQQAAFSRIDHDDAMVATVYQVVLPDGTPLILKICSRPPDFFREVFFLNHFATTLPVPRIVALVDPKPGIDPAILMEYLPGTLLTEAGWTAPLAHEIGSLLARMHLNRTDGYGDLTQPDDLSLDPRIHFTQKFEEGLEECNNHLPGQMLDQCRRYYDTHLHLFGSVDGPCIIHRDFRSGNLIVDCGKLQGIIDWSSGRAGFAEEDFCSMEHTEWKSNPYKKIFLEGYSSIRKIPDYHAIMPLLRLNKAIATIGFTVKRGTWQSKSAALYRLNRAFLDAFLNQ